MAAKGTRKPDSTNPNQSRTGLTRIRRTLGFRLIHHANVSDGTPDHKPPETTWIGTQLRARGTADVLALKSPGNRRGKDANGFCQEADIPTGSVLSQQRQKDLNVHHRAN
jgi:hypothetical protein